MIEARDIIANALRGPQPSVKDSEAFIVSDYDAHMVSANIVLAALTAAGYRVVREGDLDAATVERCAKQIERGPYFHRHDALLGAELAASLRALVGEAK